MSDEIRKRPNRAHGAVDRLPEEVRLQIKDWYLAGRTYEAISALLSEEGFDVGRMSIWRWIARQRRELDRIQEMQERAAALAKYFRPQNATVESATTNLLQAMLMESLVGANLMQVQSVEDLTKVAHAAGRLQTSAVARDKWEHDKGRRIREAVTVLKADVQQMIAHDEDLLTRIIALVEQAEERMMEKVA
jgi:hypothetical protein